MSRFVPVQESYQQIGVILVEGQQGGQDLELRGGTEANGLQLEKRDFGEDLILTCMYI